MTSITTTNSGPALVIGCGYLGRRVAGLWQAEGRAVSALTRHNGKALATLGINPILGDILDPQSLRELPRVSTVLYAVGFDRSVGRPMREVYVQGLANVLAVLPKPDRFLYASSTSVYGQTDGSWVNEEAATEPREESGRIVLEAEQLLRSRWSEAIVLRFAGIYGPGRLFRRDALLRGEPLSGDADKWLNLIHVADGASAVVAAERRGGPGQTFNVADDEPVSRRDFYSHLAELLNAPPARFEPSLSPVEETNRRISNCKLRGLGWSPAFTNYRLGLPDAIASP